MRSVALPLRLPVILLILFLSGGALPVFAQRSDDSSDRRSWQFASGTGNLLYLGLGVLRPVLIDGSSGGERTGRTADALLVTGLVTQGLKRLTREERPDGSNRESFPSGHASAAFAIAAMESHWHRGETPLWFLGAGLIGASRVKLRRHYRHDVLAGAALGYVLARVERAQPAGLLTAPFVRRDRSGRWVSFDIRF
ncbi:MAG: phosphatase PAP2 family protein [Capsulimonadales bacterium]|nr:phosphatase PAP2 family protein [Capsulimonadales bacterium]